jgi:hypothetical protein
MRRLSYLALGVAVLAAAGCGGDGLRRVSIQGKVTAKGGAPVANATVLFSPQAGTKGEGGIGTTNAEGAFTVTGSRQGASGIVPGKYKVTVSRFVNPDGSSVDRETFKEAENPFAFESVPRPYSGPDSPLEVTIPDQGGAVAVEIPVSLIAKKR